MHRRVFNGYHQLCRLAEAGARHLADLWTTHDMYIIRSDNNNKVLVATLPQFNLDSISVPLEFKSPTLFLCPPMEGLLPTIDFSGTTCANGYTSRNGISSSSVPRLKTTPVALVPSGTSPQILLFSDHSLPMILFVGLDS